jgi:hypothetical protein
MMIFLLPFVVLVGAVMMRRPPTPVPALAAGMPSPIAVLCACLRQGERPPPIVVQCAIAEARLGGHHELAHDLVAKFGEQGTLVGAGAARAMAPRASAPRARSATKSAPVHAAEPVYNDDEYDNTDDVGAEGVDMSGEYDREDDHRAEREIAQTPSAPPMPSAPVITSGSPLKAIDDRQWVEFCGRLVRELATFDSQRNVGRYRHRKDRLAQIGFDPDSIVGAAEAQDAAFAADIADAHRHLTSAGMTKEYLDRPISIPDVEGSIPLTLSGMLGLCAVAGLEGAAGWLENKADRKRCPHTTQAFLRTNGVF